MKPKFLWEIGKRGKNMDIYLIVLIGLLGLCVGALIGLGISFKIDRDYILGMNDTSEKFTKIS